METWPDHRFVEQVLQSQYAANHGVFVEGSDFALNRRSQGDRRSRGPHRQIDSGVQALSVEQIIGRFEFALRAPIFQVSYHTHYFHVGISVTRATGSDFLTDRIGIWKIASRQGFADDGHWRRIRGIVLSKETST